MHNALEIKKYDLIVNDSYTNNKQDQDFVDINLSSDDDEKVKEWIAYKHENKSFSESYGMMSTLLQSERKNSAYSKPGSMVDSFSVNLNLQNK